MATVSRMPAEAERSCLRWGRGAPVGLRAEKALRLAAPSCLVRSMALAPTFLIILKGSSGPHVTLVTRAESAIFPFTWLGRGLFLKEKYINRSSTFIFLTCSKNNFPILPCLLSSCYSRLCYCFNKESAGVDNEQDCFIKSFTQLDETVVAILLL